MTITNFTAHESDGEHATGFDDETRDGAASAHQAETETGRSSTSARPGGYGPGGYGPGGYG
ncbi:MAG: hypothetical protein ACRDZ5_03590, partial [Acidimicrobiales bacterium]